MYLLPFQRYLSIPIKQFVFHSEAPLVSGNSAAANSSSDSVSERSDELAPRKLGQESLRSDKKDENDPLADMAILVGGFHK